MAIPFARNRANLLDMCEEKKQNAQKNGWSQTKISHNTKHRFQFELEWISKTDELANE